MSICLWKLRLLCICIYICICITAAIYDSATLPIPIFATNFDSTAADERTISTRELSDTKQRGLRVGSRRCRRLYPLSDLRFLRPDNFSDERSYHQHLSHRIFAIHAALHHIQRSRHQWKSATKGAWRPDRISHPRSRNLYSRRWHSLRQRAHYLES